MSNIIEISIKNQVTKKRDLFESYMFKEGKISLYANEIRNEVSNIEPKGICMKRFKADLVTIGLDYMSVKVNDIIRIGKLEIQVSQVGKPCHSSHCIAYDEYSDCVIQSGVIFGEILQAGIVSVGDEF